MSETKERGDQTSVRLQDIADRCGLALGTVSMALRGDKRITEETAQLVRRVAAEMGYDPARNSAARRLASSRYDTRVLSHIVGFFFAHQPDFSVTNYFFRVVQGVLQAVAGSEFEILTSAWSPASSPVVQIQIAHPYRGGDVDGVIALEQAFFLERFLRLLRDEPNFGNRPIVGLVDHCDGTSGVYADHVRSGYLVMSHLLELGHQRIIDYRTPLENDEKALAGQRYEGYRLACADKQLTREQMLVPVRWHHSEPEQTEALVDELTRGATAVICASDYDAVRMHGQLLERGFRVPDDVSLISYDDTDPIPGPNGENTLTTVHIPLTEIGFEGTNLAIRRILGEEKQNRDVILPVELIVRASTAPPRLKR